MILDVLENADTYAAINPGFPKAFEFLKRPDLRELPVDRYEIDGDRVFAMVAKDQGRKREDAELEAHDNYIDVQFVLSGVDEMGWRPTATCKEISVPYDAAKDLKFFKDRPDAWLATHPGAFAIFFPEDAHMPLIASGELHKVIVKVAVNQG